MTEVAGGLCHPEDRGLFKRIWELFAVNPNNTLVGPDPEVFTLGLDLYFSRADKHWSLTDCLSFVVMHQHGLTDALTGDKHFEQAGFRPMLGA